MILKTYQTVMINNRIHNPTFSDNHTTFNRILHFNLKKYLFLHQIYNLYEKN